ncbi:MAG TPA: AI-2E family transporter [Vicinamibacteria bacterium]|nr:AI-2E family transporter [Vicinamibacteria bacterium]
MKDLLRRPLVKVILAAAVLAVLLWSMNRLKEVLTPFAIAFAVAYFLNPPVNAMERGLDRVMRRLPFLRQRLHPRMAAVGILAVVVAVAAAAVLLFVVPAAYHQASDTAAKVPDYLKILRAKVEPAYERLHVRYPQQTEEAQKRALAFLKDNLPQILSPMTRGLSAAFSSLLSFVLTLLNVFIIPVFAFYLLYDMNEIRAGVRDLVPFRHRAYLSSRLGEVDHLLSAFARGQITVCLILGSFYAIALTLCGVPMGLLVGMAIGFFNLVPFMSYILGLPLALLLSWLDDQSLPTLGAVAVVFLVGQFVEGNIVTPRIVGETLGLHAVVIMLAVLVGGTLFGFIGMLVAMPTTAALSVFWADLRDWYLGSDYYRGDPTSTR